MKIRRPARLRDDPAWAWAFAAGVFLTAVGIRIALFPIVPAGLPYLSFMPAIILATYFSGLLPAIAVACASTLTAWYFFVPPAWSLELTRSGAITLVFFVVVSAIDIAIIHIMNVALDRLSTERAKSAALAQQRELLFSELQHRISNNLSVVAALLNLQRAELQDEKAKQALTEAATRLSLIAKIQRKLHNPDGGGLRFGAFLEDLCHDVLEASGARNIVCRVSAANAPVAADQLVPFALIVTELISNAIEHGFANAQKGTIRVDFTPTGAENILTIDDDGAGPPENFSLENVTSTGLRIVQSLARQLEGHFTISRAAGTTTCVLAFPA